MTPFKQFKYMFASYIFYSLYYSFLFILVCIPIYILICLIKSKLSVISVEPIIFVLTLGLLYLEKKILSKVIDYKYKYINIKTNVNTKTLYLIGFIILLVSFLVDIGVDFCIKNVYVSYLCSIVVDYFVLNFIFSKMMQIKELPE